MQNLSQKIQQFLLSNGLQICLTFLFSGVLAGAIFTWLTRLSTLEDFFYISDPKIPVARFSWYITFGLIFTSGLVGGFLVSLRRSNFIRKFRLTKARFSLSCVLFAGTVPLLHKLFGIAFSLFDSSVLLIMPFLFLTLFSTGMCIITRSLRLIPLAFLASVIFTAIGAAAYSAIFWHLRGQGSFVLEFGQWTFLFSSLSLCFGSWLLWRARE